MREYCGAIDSLFHCFDRNTALAASSSTTDDKNRSFRYATLNLAILHAQFGQKYVFMVTHIFLHLKRKLL